MINKILKQNNTASEGFTIIETLVAIAILMISIAGPLTIAQKGLTASVYAKDQIVASFLAQDAMEFIKNEKSNSSSFDIWLKKYPDCVYNSDDPNGTQCAVDTFTIKRMYDKPCNIQSCLLNIQPDGTYGFTSNTNTIPSRFTRSFYFDNLVRNSSVDPYVSAELFVVVTWNTGTISNSVRLKNQLFDVSL